MAGAKEQSMNNAEFDSFKVLKDCAQNIDKKIAKVERELLCPSLFGDPIKAAASEEFVDQRIEEVRNIKEHIKKLIEETRQSLENQKKFNEKLSTTKNTLIQHIVETESHLQKYGYEPLRKDNRDLLPRKEEESCDNSKKITEDSCISHEDAVTKDFEDSNLSYKECLTPFVSVAQSRSNTKVSSDTSYVPRKLVEDDSTVSKSVSDKTIITDSFNVTPGYSETFYELERKYKMYKKGQKGQVSPF